jgi:starch synthase
MRLSVALLSSEAAPLAKTGGLADVVAALGKHLHGAGHDVRVFMPCYSTVDLGLARAQPVAGLGGIPLEFAGHRYVYSVLEARLPDNGAPLLLIDCPVLFGRGRLYTEDVDEHLRFIAFTRAALEICQRLQWAPRILHCNDWHAGFGPLYLKSVYAWDRLFAATRSVLTIHNIGYQGRFAAERAADVGLGDATHLLHQDELRAGVVNTLRHGVIYANAVTTVSPTYAREILTSEFGMGLEDSLRARGGDLVGILNGVDYDEWDPRHDRWLPLHFDADSLDNKTRLKHTFLRRLGLHFTSRSPLVGIVSRFTVQKGLDLLFDVLPPVLSRRNFCVVALGSGGARYEDFFADLQRHFPKRVLFHRGYSDELAHWIEASADIFLMPSLYEPCGLNQMYSLRYGTIPVVHRTGGLADSVKPFDPAQGTGTGIVFDEFNTEAMAWALNTALDLYAKPRLWRRIVQNAMVEDFSWTRRGAEYVALYERLAARDAAEPC